ncbi:uncharacterized protein LOC132734522 isoform X1 [Ruditapes philippinarum]|uniref:uncharacterized protein LOC132734522 isoform X1 n=1 Tax=Ruditapes philippinarum TaxID=129788 RepID=UPI00295C36BD|nr:uncharacterized protein LOC132734522 isoform X1 [Ruditapes philippinarum]XP_060577262.1 uncharacterized protein LOC132734522 isoform X1 [Ruditapes philippinarum]
MDDCKNTVIITGFGLDIKKEDFIQHFKRFGEIQKCNLVTTGSEGIVTFADSKTAEEAVKELDGKEINGNVIRVKLMDKCYNIDNICNEDYGNTTNNQKDIPCDEHHKKKFGGGKGGKGGTGSLNVPSGHDGEDGEPGPGGKGGAGGKPAITNPNLGKRAFESNGENMKNKYECIGGGKGGKGGTGGRNVPSGHDGEDGEPGPGGKGGAGGRPAVLKNDYRWNGYWNNNPWYTRWFGLGRPNKKNAQEYNYSGGGKGGKGGIGGLNVPSGHDGEDGEAGPGGKGGAGGRPAV